GSIQTKEIASHQVVAGAARADAAVAVGGDDIARAGSWRRRDTANSIASGTAVDQDSLLDVSERAAAGDVDADVVARHQVVIGAAAGDVNAVSSIARDEVASTGNRAADGVTGRAAVDEHAVAIGQRQRTADVGADVIALDDVAGRTAV